MTAPDPSELARLEDLAADLAVEAGTLITAARVDDLEISTKSTSTDVVTVMDQRAQDLIRRRLAQERPGDGFYGEEEGGHAAESEITWVVDPIDGTVNYLYRIPAYAVSIAAVTGDPSQPGKWEPVAGAVYDPESGELFRAHRGGGAWRDRRKDGRSQGSIRLEVPTVDDLSQSLIGTGFGYDAEVRTWQARVLLEVLPRVRDIRRIGSAALDICHVADCRLDGYYERGLNPWDLAAAWLVLTEAGGVLTGLAGGPERSMVIGAGPALHSRLHDLVTEAVAAVDGDQAAV
jgi:myo-inositol-1(or 4)-monophosphatase